MAHGEEGGRGVRIGHGHGHGGEHAHGGAHAHAHEHEHEYEYGHGRGALERGAGNGKVLFLDAFSGVAGDMLVAALIDLGVPTSVIEAGLKTLALDGYHLHVSRTARSGIAACKFDVHVGASQPARDYTQIVTLIEAAALDPAAKRIALAAFRVLAEAEARVHGVAVERVHFHEVGAVDSIVDIVASAIALAHLGAEVVTSPLPMSRGVIRTDHGLIPLPAPATLECLRGLPTYATDLDLELVTPTGACLVASTATRATRWPNLTPERTGWGAGTRELPDRPNLLRVVLGRSTELTHSEGRHVLIEANVDDLTGELAARCLSQAQRAGALDAWSVPIGMKKGRPALMLCALVEAARAPEVAHALLAESSSLGLRMQPVDRLERKRRHVQVSTDYGPIAVKVADGDGLPPNVAPEYESCLAAAEAHGVALKQVYAAALAAYAAQAGGP
jgi:uncharacterized protein (TIGR00299 family) protein